MVREVFKKRIGNYLVGRTIGEVLQLKGPADSPAANSASDLCLTAQGTYAKVKYGQHCETEELVAIKVNFGRLLRTLIMHIIVHCSRALKVTHRSAVFHTRWSAFTLSAASIACTDPGQGELG